MNVLIPAAAGRSPGILARGEAAMARWNDAIQRRICLLDARIRTCTAEPEEGAATAEYAVVLVAATGFAVVLGAILRSGAIKSALTEIIQSALQSK